MSVVRSYNVSNGRAVNDAPVSIVRVLSLVSAQAGGGSGAVASVDGRTGAVSLADRYQPLDSDLTAIAALATTAFGRSLLTAADAAAARVLTGAGTSNLALGTTSSTAKAGDYQPTAADISDASAIGRTVLKAADAAAIRSAIGAGTSSFDGAYVSLTGKPTLGTAAAADTGDFDPAGSAAAAQAASQPVDGDLTAIAALTTSAYGRAFLELANQGALMALLAAASSTAQGIVELATNTEATTGTDTARAVTPAGVAAALAAATLTESQVTGLTTDLAAKVPTTRTVSAGTGLTGGGDLSANRTLAADFGTGSGKVTQGNDSRLSDARTPTAHASSHASGGTDAVALDASQVTRTTNAQIGTTYTLVLADASKFVTLSNASAITLTVPPNSSVAFPVGTEIILAQLGAGQVTIAQGSGVTVNATPGLKVAAQYGTAALKKTATDTWLAFGRLAA